MSEINNIPPTAEVDSNVEKASIGTDNMNQLPNETTEHKCEEGCVCSNTERAWNNPQDIILDFNTYYMRKAELDNFPFLAQTAEIEGAEDENHRIAGVFQSNYESLQRRYDGRRELAGYYNHLLFRFYEYCSEGNYSVDFNTFLCMWTYVCEGTGDLVRRVTATIEMYNSFNRTLMR